MDSSFSRKKKAKLYYKKYPLNLTSEQRKSWFSILNIMIFGIGLFSMSINNDKKSKKKYSIF
jgi:hypothetical protein